MKKNEKIFLGALKIIAYVVKLYRLQGNGTKWKGPVRNSNFFKRKLCIFKFFFQTCPQV